MFEDRLINLSLKLILWPARLRKMA